jgi:hypothetical protein
MSFSLPKFLRKVSAQTLQIYFDERPIIKTSAIKWGSSPRELVGAVWVAIEDLPDRERERVYDDFERTSQLADDTGQLALRGMLGGESELLCAISEMESPEDRALWVLLRRPEAFDRALSFAYAERLLYGRSWSRFRLSGPISLDPDEAAIDAMGREIRGFFEEFDGSGRRLLIDHFDRGSAKAADRLVQYTIYVEKLPESSLEFAGAEPERRTIRPVREAALCMDHGVGVLDVMSEGGKRLREKLARTFAQFALGDTAEVELMSRRDFHLDRLKRLIPFPTDAKDGIRNVAVTRLALAPASGSYGRVTVEVGKTSTETIHASSERWFGHAEPIGRLEWRIVQATLRIAFHPEVDGGREKVVNVTLRMPNGSDLRNQTRRHQLVSEKYLERWGLVAPA